MRLRKHIAHMLLTDDRPMEDYMNSIYGEDWRAQPIENTEIVYELISRQAVPAIPHTVYWVTDTVTDKLDLLHVNRSGKHFNWSVFNHLPECKKTFIFKDNTLLRVLIVENAISFAHISYEPGKDNWYDGNLRWQVFHYFKETGFSETATEMVTQKEEAIYKLFCFIFLSENTEEIVKPGHRRNINKSDPFVNDLLMPVTIVNSKWNITVIRTEGFPVSGHFRIQGTGPGRTVPKMIWIDPYDKHGYIRKAAGHA